MLCRLVSPLVSPFSQQPRLAAVALQGKRMIAKPRPIGTPDPDWNLKIDQWRFTGAGHLIKALCKQRNIYRDLVEQFAPIYELRVSYNDKPIICGESIDQSETLAEPAIQFLGEPGTFYTLLMTDIDYPSNFKPLEREFLLWAKTNVLFDGTTPQGGDLLCEYVAPCPPEHTGSHRIAVLIAKQNNGKIENTDKLFIPRDSAVGRPKFNTRKYCGAHELTPQSLVFFQTRFERTVNHVFRQMKQEPPVFINPKTAHMVEPPTYATGSRYKNQQH